MVATLTFLGAAGTVTGSKFLLQHDRRQTLVDCGLYQGERAWRRKNWEPLPVRAAAISGVVLTHAHLDRCGHLQQEDAKLARLWGFSRHDRPHDRHRVDVWRPRAPLR